MAVQTYYCPSCNGQRVMRGMPCGTCRGHGKVTLTDDAMARLRALRGMGAGPSEVMVASVTPEPCPSPTQIDLQNTIDYLIGARPASMYLDTPTLIRQGDQIVINPNKDFQEVHYVPAISGTNTFPVPIANAGETVNASMTAFQQEGDQGDLELVKFMGFGAQGRLEVTVTQSGLDRIFMNSPVSDRLFFGTSAFPAMIGQSLFLPATQSLTWKLRDVSGIANNNAAIVAHGRKFRQPPSIACRERALRDSTKRDSHFFLLTFNDGSSVQLAAGQTTPSSYFMRVPAGAYFECFGIMDDSDGAYDMQLVRGANGQSLMSQGQLLPARDFVVGPTQAMQGVLRAMNGAANPFTWPFTQIFKPSSDVRVDLLNKSGQTNNVRLVLWGRLLYYPLGK